VLQNDGTGAFVPAGSMALGRFVSDVALGDFDGDGDLDALVTGSSPAALLIFLNAGNGTFQLSSSQPLPSPATSGVLADFDGDGDLDVAALQTSLQSGSGQITICYNVNGVLQAFGQGFSTGEIPSGLLAADFDGDGHVDLATCIGSANTVSILHNRGDGTFAPAISRATYASSGSLAAMDADGDGNLDIVVPNVSTSSISVVHACSNGASVFCAGDGSATACPCGNTSPAGAGAGCLNSLGAAGTLRAQGFANLSVDTLVLLGANMPNSFALYFQGTVAQNGGNGVVFGDGLRCVAGSVVRLRVEINSGGASHYPGSGDLALHVRGGVGTAGNRYYQVWYRNAASFCSSATFNLTNGLRIAWAP
jgi:hypothetical protein